MKVYHMSDTLSLGTELSPNYKKYWELTEPFLQALEKSEECFYGVYFASKFMSEALDRFKMADMQTDYVKWATEGIFEYVRQKEYPQCCCRLMSNYYFDNIPSCLKLYKDDWGRESEEERAKIKLFEVELFSEDIQRYDMRLFDEAYDNLYEENDIKKTINYARKYFSGNKSESPVLEIVSDKKAVVIRDLSNLLAK